MNLQEGFSDFVGRQNELALLKNLVQQGRTGVQFIHGIHGIGKTYLCLKFREAVASEEIDFVYINFQEELFKNSQSMFEYACKKIQPEWNWMDLLGKEHNFIESIKNRSGRFILVIEEIEKLLTYYQESEFMDLIFALDLVFRNPSEDDGQPLIVITARKDWRKFEVSVSNINQSPRFLTWEPIYLGALTKESTNILVERKADANINSFAGYWRDLITNLSGGHPFIALIAVRRLQASDMATLELEKFVDEILFQVDPYFTSIWNHLSDQEQLKVLQIHSDLISSQSIRLGQSQITLNGRDAHMRYLKLIGLVSEDGNKLFSPLFAWWIAQRPEVLRTMSSKAKSSEPVLQTVKTYSDLLASIPKLFQNFASLLALFEK